jgi:hypothetical protein
MFASAAADRLRQRESEGKARPSKPKAPTVTPKRKELAEQLMSFTGYEFDVRHTLVRCEDW